jgi:hypothetical protein
VRQPSLYKHVGGIYYLQQRIAVRATNELADVLARAAFGRWRDDAIVSMPEVYRRWVLDHRRTSTTRRKPSRSAGGADALAGYQHDAVDAIRALRAALHGFASLEVEGGFGLPVDVDRSRAPSVHEQPRCR